MKNKIEERLSKEVEKILSDGIINLEEIDVTQEKLMKAFNQVLQYQKSLIKQE